MKETKKDRNEGREKREWNSYVIKTVIINIKRKTWKGEIIKEIC